MLVAIGSIIGALLACILVRRRKAKGGVTSDHLTTFDDDQTGEKKVSCTHIKPIILYLYNDRLWS